MLQLVLKLRSFFRSVVGLIFGDVVGNVIGGLIDDGFVSLVNDRIGGLDNVGDEAFDDEVFDGNVAVFENTADVDDTSLLLLISTSPSSLPSFILLLYLNIFIIIITSFISLLF